MIDFWNQRYSDPNFAYGKLPNEFFKEQVQQLPPNSKILFPAEGEGRNAVYAATQGHFVWAFDQSEQGKIKAISLAEERGVQIQYDVLSASAVEYQQHQFDAIVLIYAHFHQSQRHELHQRFLHWLKPNGTVILEAFSQNHPPFQQEYPHVGGPSSPELLYSEEILHQDFPNFEIHTLKTEVIELQEGNCHSGKGSVVRFVGTLSS